MIDIEKLFSLNDQLEKNWDDNLRDSFRGFKVWFDSYRNGDVKLDRNLKGMIDHNLTEEEAFLVLTYTASKTSSWVNHDLRNGNTHKRADKILYSEYLSFVLNKIPPFNNALAFRMETEVSDDEEVLNWFESKMGRTFVLPYFLSTSKEDWGNDQLVWQIQTLPKNSLARDISNLTNNPPEQEILFNKGAKFLIKGVDKEKCYVYLDEIDSQHETSFALTGLYHWNIR
ncbi:ADP-ribosyltransferase [Rufibacter quisquiliarum]|uniref:ADP ribosyltransferase domain-containing protein n=1 Tax=Rufibacter quisquiliarum TaxID=1549639 RepID=A0A839GMZ9_9BACT|nr:ADP-ribosyltransferase [Rufibacter quisquiliarum]MBA9078189.1 hypothetical protein [Rufibacter quisquiliarum]